MRTVALYILHLCVCVCVCITPLLMQHYDNDVVTVKPVQMPQHIQPIASLWLRIRRFLYIFVTDV